MGDAIVPRFTSVVLGGLAATVAVLLFSYLGSTGGFPPNPLYGCLACLSYMISGLVAVWHYTSEYSVTLSGGEGVKIGMFSGVTAGVLAAIVVFLLTVLGVMPGPEEMLEAMERSGMLDQPGAEFSVRMMEMFSGPLGFVISLVQGTVVGGVMGGGKVRFDARRWLNLSRMRTALRGCAGYLGLDDALGPW